MPLAGPLARTSYRHVTPLLRADRAASRRATPPCRRRRRHRRLPQRRRNFSKSFSATLDENRLSGRKTLLNLRASSGVPRLHNETTS